MGQRFGKNISKNVNGKYSQNPLDQAKQSATDQFKTASKRAIQKAAGETNGLIGNKTADEITRVSKISQQDNSETVTNEHDKEILKERYISPDERQKIIYYLRLI